MSQSGRNYYEILIVASNASLEEITEARKRQMQFYHPDRFDQKKSPDLHKQALEETKLINIAFEVLADPEKRAEYDKETGLGPPCPVITPDHLVFQKVKPGSPQRSIFNVDNRGGDFSELHINDNQSSQLPESWIRIVEYDDSRFPIRVVVEAKGTRENTHYSGFITVKMDNIEKRVPVEMSTIKKPASYQVESYNTVPSYMSAVAKKPANSLLKSHLVRHNIFSVSMLILFIISVVSIFTFFSPRIPDMKSDLTGKLLFTEQKGLYEGSDLFLANADGSGPHKIAEDQDGIDLVDISADGTRIMVNQKITGPEGDVISSFSTLWVAWTQRLSPDGLIIVYREDYKGNQNNDINNQFLTITNCDGSGQRQLIGGCAGACWSPDGNRIACIIRNKLILMDLNGKLLQTVMLDTKDYGLDWNLDWSPDGSKILLTELNHSYSSMIISLKDSKITYIDELVCANARWLPNSKYIAYSEYFGREIKLFDPSTGARSTLLESKQEIGSFAFSMR